MKPEIITLDKGTIYFRNRSIEELREIIDAHVRDGQTLDSAGEPRIYSSTFSDVLEEDTVVTITKKRVPRELWDTWRQRPGRLTEGLATIDGIPQVIMFGRSKKRGWAQK